MIEGKVVSAVELLYERHEDARSAWLDRPRSVPFDLAPYGNVHEATTRKVSSLSTGAQEPYVLASRGGKVIRIPISDDTSSGQQPWPSNIAPRPAKNEGAVEETAPVSERMVPELVRTSSVSSSSPESDREKETKRDEPMSPTKAAELEERVDLLSLDCADEGTVRAKGVHQRRSLFDV